MSIVRRAARPESSFYILDKKISEDRRLSWAARGVLVFLLGKPDNWQVSVAHLINETKGAIGKSSGRDAVYAVLAELIDAGYISRQQGRAEAGKLAAIEYLVSEIPAPRAPSVDVPGQPHTGLPDTAGPLPANPPLASTDSKQGLKPNEGGKGGEGGGEKLAEPAWPVLPGWIPQKAWDDWSAMRDKRKDPLTPRAAELAIEFLAKRRAAGDEPADVLNQSFLSKCVGLFPVKGNAKAFSGESARERRVRERVAEMTGGLASAADPSLPKTAGPAGPALGALQ